MPAWIIGGALLGSSLLGASASSDAAQTQADAANTASGVQRQNFLDQQAAQEPFRQGGMAAQNRLMTLLGLTPSGTNSGLSVDPNSPDYGKYAKDFGVSDFQADPGYNFRLTEGLKALDRQAAARGGLISGSALKAAQGYGQDQASQEYTNAFNRYQTNRSNQLNPLQSLMGAGQSATNQVGAAGQAMANNVGELGMQAGAARASGYVGGANSINQGIGSYLNYQNSQNMMNRLFPSSAGGSAGTTPSSAGYGLDAYGSGGGTAPLWGK